MTDSNEPANQNNAPIASRQFDRVHAAIWRRNESDDRGERVLYSITFSRNFRNGDGQWQRAYSFTSRDLPHVGLAVDWALCELALKES